MKNKIRVLYSSETGKILGYYPYSIEYSDIPSPCIDISNEQYSLLLQNEEKFRIRNGELVSIEDSAEYFMEEKNSLLSQISYKIEQGAILAKEWGILELNQCYVNVHWKEYYSSLLNCLDSQKDNIHIKIYELESDQYFFNYKEFTPSDAKEFLTNALEAIEDYKTQYIPTEQTKFIQLLQEVQSSQNLVSIKALYDSVNYGCVINELESIIPLKAI
jgi:hypothetical protein